jgi:hypothetical protein
VVSPEYAEDHAEDLAEPGVCGDVLWCGLPAGHDPFDDDGTDPRGGHRVTADGVYLGMPAEVYHRDPVIGRSLTASGVKRIRPPGCPAKFLHWRENAEPSKPSAEAGTLAHAVLLGVGPRVVLVEPNEKSGRWDTNALRAKVAAIRDAGGVPVKPDELERAQDMADAIADHERAYQLLFVGQPEAVIVWTDPDTGVRCRAMLDVLPPAVDGVIHLPDYKTTENDASPGNVERLVDAYGWHVQMAFRRRGLRALGLAGDVRCFDVVQERTPPYLVHPVELDMVALKVGDYEVRRALEDYAECDRTGVWWGYGTGLKHLDPTLVSVPMWTARRYEDVI